MSRTCTSTTVEETWNFAKQVAKDLKGGEILALYGDLGTGKTTFVQGLAKELGVKNRITSPTFLIVRKYEIKNKKSKFFCHIDLYRTESKDDLEGLGLREILEDKNNIIAIEWPEKMKELLPAKRWDILFTYIDENTRTIQIKTYE